MIKKILMMAVTAILTLSGCRNERSSDASFEDDFDYFVEQFADLKIMKYRVPGFEDLSLKQKKLIYYLSQAAICGRDIIYDQNGKYNLAIRRTLETIYSSFSGDRETDDFRNFETYTKRVWFSNGIYHHYSSDKFKPAFSREYFTGLVYRSDTTALPLREGETVDEFLEVIVPVMFDPDVLPKKVFTDTDQDIVANSAVNFYENVTEQEAVNFYNSMKVPGDTTPVSYGLNTKLVKENGLIKENVYKLNGLYGEAISQIVYWLEKASGVAENEEQKQVIDKLVEYYITGDLETFDEYSILWVNDLDSRIDFVNGFIETYEDPLGMKATWEALVNFKDLEATRRTEIISANAQWFEDNSPIDERFKKNEVKGVTAKVITAAMLGGDCYPATPIGINLPNADWIRKLHGSKSVTIENITYAYDQVSLGSGFLEEFASGQEEIDLIKKYGYQADNLQVDLHECLGHGSGQLLPGTSPDALKNYASSLEEVRADLFSLYFIADEKMLELGLLPDYDAVKAKYLAYIRNGLMTQLVRIEEGKDIEQAHMRCRQIISRWAYEHGKTDHVIEAFTTDGNTYYRINDFQKLRMLFGELLAEVQRIKSEGDYEAGRELVETYGIRFDRKLHQEVLARYEKLNLVPYGGFLNPMYEPVEENGELVDVRISFSDSYAGQMMYYSKNYSFLPTWN
ncbi:MAG: dihydrofolate reductase [Bacteroidales bacterium]|nr:dihydrofolate reductase [Bacteroidales bacterium]